MCPSSKDALKVGQIFTIASKCVIEPERHRTPRAAKVGDIVTFSGKNRTSPQMIVTAVHDVTAAADPVIEMRPATAREIADAKVMQNIRRNMALAVNARIVLPS